MEVRTNTVRRVTVAFPADLWNKLESTIPSEERDRFIVEATEQFLRQEGLRRVLAELRETPAWSDEDHPDLVTVEDVDHYIRRLRETSMPRTWDEIVAEDEKEIDGGQSSAG
jgi:hypothetical protein